MAVDIHCHIPSSTVHMLTSFDTLKSHQVSLFCHYIIGMAFEVANTSLWTSNWRSEESQRNLRSTRSERTNRGALGERTVLVLCILMSKIVRWDQQAWQKLVFSPDLLKRSPEQIVAFHTARLLFCTSHGRTACVTQDLKRVANLSEGGVLVVLRWRRRRSHRLFERGKL